MDRARCRAKGGKLVTFELSEDKVRVARQTVEQTGINSLVQIVQGDALEHVAGFQKIGFCFLDTEKDLYQKCYDLVVPHLVEGGFLIADNVISHQSGLASFIDQVRTDNRMDSVQVPIGTGVLVCRRI